jgi:hypothetical protein
MVRDRCAGFSGKIFVTGATDTATGGKSFVKRTTSEVGGVSDTASWEVWGFPVSNGRVTSDVLDEELAALRSESNGLDPDVCVTLLLLFFFILSFCFDVL